MYNAPRVATIRAITPATLWAVDRATFRRIVVDSSVKQRARYESFLAHVPLFANLTKYERSQIADCLDAHYFKDGDYILKQGEPGEKFYIIVEGECRATQTPEGKDKEVETGRMKVGDYFGERALINNSARMANVIAVGSVKCASMDCSAFERLLGPCRDILHRKMSEYKDVTIY